VALPRDYIHQSSCQFSSCKLFKTVYDPVWTLRNSFPTVNRTPSGVLPYSLTLWV
jgi:hypothetical protein